MSLRDQFETWALKHKPKGMWKFENETAWQAYQAGHAASGRDELLAALEQCLAHIELKETSETDSVVAQIARDAIKKARGEA